jgi:hypothetical protein
MAPASPNGGTCAIGRNRSGYCRCSSAEASFISRAAFSVIHDGKQDDDRSARSMPAAFMSRICTWASQ